jgi:hypothetical protein
MVLSQRFLSPNPLLLTHFFLPSKFSPNFLCLPLINSNPAVVRDLRRGRILFEDELMLSYMARGARHGRSSSPSMGAGCFLAEAAMSGGARGEAHRDRTLFSKASTLSYRKSTFWLGSTRSDQEVQRRTCASPSQSSDSTFA